MFAVFFALALQTQVLPVVPAISTLKAGCLTDADGAVRCGFSCTRSARGQVACAQEPGGSCLEGTDGTLTCSTPLGLTLHLPLTQAECRDGADGRTGCGYGCVVDVVGKVHCANSPDGACAVSPAGKATCTRFDLDQRVFVLTAPVTPGCLQDKDGGVRCGFACVKSPRGSVRCAQTPDGACRADRDGVVVCTGFQPEKRVYLGAPPPSTCVRGARGQATCGYGCTTDTTGGARCSASPFGACARGTAGHVRCFPDDDDPVGG